MKSIARSLIMATMVAVLVHASLNAAQDAPPATAPATLPTSHTDFDAAAREVTQHIQTTFYLPDTGLYAHSVTDRHPDFMWGNGVMFSALVGAARHDGTRYLPILNRFFTALDHYWDTRVPIPGYEPSSTAGGGHDKYYDDNAWMVLAFTEAYDVTRDQRYLRRAQQALDFTLSGWDEQLGGGIWWHEGHKDGSKNTCANAPAAVGCLRMADYQPPAQAKASVAMAKRIVEWTIKNLELPGGLYADAIKVDSGKVNQARLTYNTALMIRAFLGLYRHAHDVAYLDKARRAAAASDWFLDQRTHAYRDSVKFSHLLVEADLEMYRATHDEHLLHRAITNAEFEYANWKRQPPAELIENAAVARMLWLMVDVQSRPQN